MITDTACIALQDSAEERPSVPPWFAEVVLIAPYLIQQGVLEALTHQVRLVRGRFGQYEVIDFLVLLFGYAMSGVGINWVMAIPALCCAFAVLPMALANRAQPEAQNDHHDG